MATVAFLYNRKKKLDKLGKASIDLRITINRTSHYLSSGIKVIPGHWDMKKNEVKKHNRNWYEFNQVLANKKEVIEDYFAKCMAENNIPVYSEIKDLFKPNTSSGLVSFIEKELNNRKSIKLSTYNHHKSQLNKLKLFRNEIGFNEVNFELLQEIENFLIGKGQSKNSIWNFHKWIKTYINIAIKKGIIEKNPYDNFKIKYEQTKRVVLTFQELKNFEEIEIDNDVPGDYQLVKDKFLFSCYTGLRISDVHNIKNENFEFDGDKCYLTFKMVKTMKFIDRMPLHELFNGKCIDLVKTYYSNDEFENLFPKQSEQHINRYLKDLAKLAKIKKNLTYHVSRHTFGSCLAEVTGDPFLIMQLMGHSKIDTSMSYVHMNNKRVERKLNRFDFNY